MTSAHLLAAIASPRAEAARFQGDPRRFWIRRVYEIAGAGLTFPQFQTELIQLYCAGLLAPRMGLSRCEVADRSTAGEMRASETRPAYADDLVWHFVVLTN